jgi:hypothetical protein
MATSAAGACWVQSCPTTTDKVAAGARRELDEEAERLAEFHA